VAAPLKQFHNEIKRRLIYRRVESAHPRSGRAASRTAAFALPSSATTAPQPPREDSCRQRLTPLITCARRFGYQKPTLLDYACGRGGDLHKWKSAQVRPGAGRSRLQTSRPQLQSYMHTHAHTCFAHMHLHHTLDNACTYDTCPMHPCTRMRPCTHANPQIKYVKGIDLSPAEVKEAERRYNEMRGRERGEGGGWRGGVGGSGVSGGCMRGLLLLTHANTVHAHRCTARGRTRHPNATAFNVPAPRPRHAVPV
jgi:hypothetical protein